MSEITLNINGQRVKVSESFLQLSPAEQEATVEEIAQSLGGASEPAGPMAQLNRGIADTFDAINPFNGGRQMINNLLGTDLPTDISAREQLPEFGINVAQGEAETVMDSALRGGGRAVAAAPMVGLGANVLSAAPGAIGAAAGQAGQALNTVRGTIGEMFGGAISEGAAQASENAGQSELAQDLWAMAAPVGAYGALQGAQAAVRRSPGVGLARQGIRDVSAAIAPYTAAGGREVARRRIRSLAGGDDRANELADMVTENNPLNLTPAQQTQDPNMMGLQQLAADQDPNLREALSQRADASRQTATNEIRAGAGDVQDARQILSDQRQQFQQRLQGMVNERLRRADAAIDAEKPQGTSIQNSERARVAIEGALEDALALERQLWSEVPKDAIVGTQEARQTALRLIQTTPQAQQNDIPEVARRLLGEAGTFGDQETVAEMHGLYSELRRDARAAMAGNDQNKNRARISNEIAEAILNDLGTTNPDDEIGNLINSARTYSAELHETFDRGAVGRILKRTLDGDSTIDSQLSLQKTVGVGGDAGAVSAGQIAEAAPGSAPFVEDYIKGMFTDAVRNTDGAFDRKAAANFMSKNRELLQKFPELRRDVMEAADAGTDAAGFAQRVEQRLASLQVKSKSTVARFLDGPPERAIKAVTQSNDPARAAAKLSAAARKDPSGEAMAGLKDAFSAELIGKDISAERLTERLNDKRFRGALKTIYSNSEIGRMNTIASELAKVDGTEAANVGTNLSGATSNKLVEYLVRVVAARQGSQMGGGAGGSLQTAQMASSRARDIMNNLTQDKASQILADAITDPKLFRDLLTDAGSKNFTQKVEATVLPYLVGAGTASLSGDQ